MSKFISTTVRNAKQWLKPITKVQLGVSQTLMNKLPTVLDILLSLKVVSDQTGLVLSFHSPCSIRWGKKLSIINHIREEHYWTVVNRATMSWIQFFTSVQYKTCLYKCVASKFIRSSLTPRQCKAQQSWACWWRPCSAWQTRHWKSGADGEAAELCGPSGWHRWY